ncbi:hypothetical protein [Streptomyces sp. SID3343]|uniref:hypothetical protein n=1 Tax=Streptomyces sp. SID3343 TaxID=2690260 RepID=UPI00136EA250|nr:hypothetical protein [Streptomyces sp. SID3343]MYW03646.1 hypothetical protein [Streptomyces sp. SID3343]
MRVRKATTAGALAIGLAVAAGIGAPSAQAAQADSRTISATTVADSGGFLTCSDPTGLPNEANSKALACLSLYNGSLTAYSSVTFTSPVPSGWTGCVMNVSLYKIASDGTETLVSAGTQKDCKATAQASGTIANSVTVPVEIGSTYRTNTGVLSSYLGVASWAVVVKSGKVTVLN